MLHLQRQSGSHALARTPSRWPPLRGALDLLCLGLPERGLSVQAAVMDAGRNQGRQRQNKQEHPTAEKFHAALIIEAKLRHHGHPPKAMAKRPSYSGTAQDAPLDAGCEFATARFPAGPPCQVRVPRDKPCVAALGSAR